VRNATLLVALANADGQLDRLKNRKRSRKRSRTVDLIAPIRRDLLTWRQESGAPEDGALVFPHAVHGRLWFADEYRNWRRRVYVPSAEAVGLPSRRPYDLRHTWASLLIAEKRQSIAEIDEQLGDKTSTVLDTYTVLNEWRGAGPVDIEAGPGRALPLPDPHQLRSLLGAGYADAEDHVIGGGLRDASPKCRGRARIGSRGRRSRGSGCPARTCSAARGCSGRVATPPRRGVRRRRPAQCRGLRVPRARPGGRVSRRRREPRRSPRCPGCRA